MTRLAQLNLRDSDEGSLLQLLTIFSQASQLLQYTIDG